MRGTEFWRLLAARQLPGRLDPRLAAFFQDYLTHEKAVQFGEQHVINSHFPPYPSRAFDAFLEQALETGRSDGARRLYSVTLAVTNRCRFACWHCYNAGRSQAELPLATWRRVAAQLQDLGAVMITLTGGEPLLREDLEDIAAAFDSRVTLVLGTTGEGLTPARARGLRQRGLFGVGVSLDSADEDEHDRLRGRPGAFRAALAALGLAAEQGLYPYVVAVARRELLVRERFFPFLDFVTAAGAREVHLLEPNPTGRLAGRDDVVLTAAERRTLFEYQAEVAAREDLPILSCFAYLEAQRFFGCGAGLTHLYIDGAGEVCPCNLVPLSFGNVGNAPLVDILTRMGVHFGRPRPGCVGQILADRIPAGTLPTSPEISREICRRCLPAVHELPRFFGLQEEIAAGNGNGHAELRAAYDQVHAGYDRHWLTEAAAPIDALVRGLGDLDGARVFEAGCGTGYATALLAAGVGPAGEVVGADLSPGMLAEAERRLAAASLRARVRLVNADALATLSADGPFDLVFSSWVLGYIPVAAFFAAAAAALRPGGKLAFVVHRQDSPREPLEIFAQLVSENPRVLLRPVTFDFPRDAAQARADLETAGFDVMELREGGVSFHRPTPQAVLDHLLGSGAGTTFYDALDPAHRPALEQRFLEELARRHQGKSAIPVTHDYVACIARTRPS